MTPVIVSLTVVACGTFVLTGILAILIDRHTRALIAVRYALEAIADACDHSDADADRLGRELQSAVAEFKRVMGWT